MSHITKLTLTTFRNYETLRLNAGRQAIVLTGPNGAGKTNLLEAVSLLAPGRGLRNVKLAEIGQMAATQPWAVAAEIATALGVQEVGTGPDTTAGDRRIVRIDGVNRAQAALSALGTILWIIPAMDRLFTEPAAQRRRFLDRIVYGYDPNHATRVAKHEQLLRERQKLLAEAHPDSAWLDSVETVLAETGVAIAAARQRLVIKLDQLCADAPPSPFPSPALSLAGELETWLTQDSALGVEDRYRRALRSNRRLDAALGRTASGAQRSDLTAHHREKNMSAALCSTGEQKALLLALILANARLMQSEMGAKPILILDEITAHLDLARREALFAHIAALEAQCWMSGIDAQSFASFGDAALHISVSNGRVTT